jgi:4'-phosphopantetheinyl transferase EntD
LPPCIAVAEADISRTDGPLWPEEAVRVARAVPVRQREFVAGRVLARQALALLGGPQTAIPAGEDRLPCWPPGYTGSISHSRQVAAAAVARLTDVAAIGIDIEEIGRVRTELAPQIASPAELAGQLTRLPDRQVALGVIFSAKEAFYKAQFPITRRFLGFLDVEVDLDPDAGGFTVWRTAASGQRLRGRFAIGAGLVAAAIWLNQRTLTA